MTQEKYESQNCMIFLMFVLIVTSNYSEKAQKGGGQLSPPPLPTPMSQVRHNFKRNQKIFLQIQLIKSISHKTKSVNMFVCILPSTILCMSLVAEGLSGPLGRVGPWSMAQSAPTKYEIRPCVYQLQGSE